MTAALSGLHRPALDAHGRLADGFGAGRVGVAGAGHVLGGAAEGFDRVETAMKLSPHDPVRPIWEHWICHLHSHLGQWEQAIEHCRLAAQGAPYLWYTYADLVAANAWLGRDAEAKAALADLLKAKPDMTAQAYTATAASYSDDPVFTQQIARMVEGMRKAGLPEE